MANNKIIIINIIINPLTARVVGVPKMILQPVFFFFLSIFPGSPLPSGTWRTPGLSILWCCLPTFSSVCLVFFPLSLCLARWFWPNLMDGKHDRTTTVCVSLRSSGTLIKIQVINMCNLQCQQTVSYYHISDQFLHQISHNYIYWQLLT